MGLVVAGLEEVRVVRGEQREIEIVGEREDLRVQIGLARSTVRLDLEVVAAGEGLGVPGGRLPGRLPVPAVRRCAISPARQAEETMSPSAWRARSSRSTRGRL